MNKLIDLGSAPFPNEPKTSLNPFYGVRKIKGMVRACILRDRSIEETLRQVHRDHGYGKEVTALVEHFYISERAA